MVIAAVCLPGKICGETDAIASQDQTAAVEAISDIAGRLDRLSPFQADIRYSVALPMTDEDVVYNLAIASSDNPSDSLLGKNYIIDWQLPSEAGISSGFTAYFDGHCYRYRDHRLLEYHHQWDSIPFHNSTGGVQRNGQFVDLVPFSIAARLRQMVADSTWTIVIAPDIVEKREVDKVNATRCINGLESQIVNLAFDKENSRPVKLSIIYNPGTPGEQEVEAVYNYNWPDSLTAASSEEQLIARYPDIFTNYRESNFSVENLRGLPLPGFALPTPTRERYLYQKGATFAFPTIIAVLEPDVLTTPKTIEALRGVVDRLPRQTSLIMMFPSNDSDKIEQLTTGLRPGETILMSARPFVRDTGINSYPTVILCASTGTVADIFLGYSTTLADILLQSAALLR